MALKILQWHLCSFYAQYNYLRLLINKYEPDIIALQETRFKNNNRIDINHYICIMKNRNSAAGGVAIYIKNSISTQRVNLNTLHEAIAIQVLADIKITICNVYFPPHSENYSIDKSEVQNIVSQLPTPFLMIGDVNAHNPLWGGDKNCGRGKMFEEIIDCNNHVSILNSGSFTHFSIFNGTFSAVDLSICSTSILNRMTWNVDDNLYGSDHFPILMNYIQGSTNPHSTPVKKWIYKKANWSTFSQHRLQHLPTLSNNVEYDTNQITTSILEAAKSSIPLSENQENRKSVPWWNKEVRIAIRDFKSFWYYCRKPQNNTLENIIILKQLKAKSRRTIKIAKQATWTQFTESLTADTPVTEMWNKINLIKGKNKSSNTIRTMEINGIILSDLKILQMA